MDLIQLTQRGDIDACRAFLEAGADVNMIGTNGFTPLITASTYGHLKIFRLLLEYRADINIKDAIGADALNRASGFGYLEICQLLLDRGADVNTQDKIGQTPLHVAAHRGHYEICRLLVEKGANINAIENENRCSPIIMAAWGHHIEVCDLLLRHGADITIKSKNGWSLLHYAARAPVGGATELTRLFLKAGCDVNSLTTVGWKNQTALHLAAINRHNGAAVCNLLLDYGADINAQCCNGYTPLINACEYNIPEICETLLNRGARVDLSTIDGETALHWSAFRGNAHICRLLINYGASPIMETHTPLSRTLTTWREHDDIVELIDTEIADRETFKRRAPLLSMFIEERYFL
ncbi:MAG: hypothetical protein F2563_04965 [Actinobacteria bacterium]|uniref:Unannotated protein n=1 Tax=freshwater metagenome TaxID=449393 RepID=A0A6J6F1K2_9ZZZZ|nr:hypothetical protein [Actinomycetota bacterium]